MNSEMIYCPKCKDFYEADSDDLATYFCPSCNDQPKIENFHHLKEFITQSFLNNIKLKDKQTNE